MRAIVIALLALLFLIFGNLTSRPLADGPRIVQLELAPTVQAAEEFLVAWSQVRPHDWQRKLTQSLQWDTWFICAYAPLFALLCWISAEHFGSTRPRVAFFGKRLAVAQLGAGALDFIENAAMKHMIDAGHAREPWPYVSCIASGIKWLLILAFAALAVIAAGHWATSRRSAPS